MELFYNDLGAWGDEYDGDEWTYEIDSEQMEDAFVNIQADRVCYCLARDISDREKNLIKETLRIVARDNDGLVEDFCKDLEDDVKDYFREEAERDMQDYNDQRASDELDYQHWRSLQ